MARVRDSAICVWLIIRLEIKNLINYFCRDPLVCIISRLITLGSLVIILLICFVREAGGQGQDQAVVCCIARLLARH